MGCKLGRGLSKKVRDNVNMENDELYKTMWKGGIRTATINVRSTKIRSHGSRVEGAYLDWLFDSSTQNEPSENDCLSFCEGLPYVLNVYSLEILTRLACPPPSLSASRSSSLPYAVDRGSGLPTDDWDAAKVEDIYTQYEDQDGKKM